MNNTNFSLVAYLEDGEYKKVRELQQKLSEITGSRKCLEDWLPHITIADGIIVSSGEMKRLLVDLSNFSQSHNVITADVKTFGGTDNWNGAVGSKLTPYVIWLEVNINRGLMKLFNDLKVKITSHYDTWLPRIDNYMPHITLAFADLSNEGYKKGLKYLSSKKLELNFSISHISLVKCYSEGNMKSKEYKRFYFNK